MAGTEQHPGCSPPKMHRGVCRDGCLDFEEQEKPRGHLGGVRRAYSPDLSFLLSISHTSFFFFFFFRETGVEEQGFWRSTDLNLKLSSVSAA